MNAKDRVLIDQFIATLETRAHARSLGNYPTLCMPVGCYSPSELKQVICSLKAKGVEVVKVKEGVL